MEKERRDGSRAERGGWRKEVVPVAYKKLRESKYSGNVGLGCVMGGNKRGVAK